MIARLAATTTLFLALTANGPPAAAQASALEGSYALVPSGSDDIREAIEETVRPMSFITRPIARGRLRKTNLPYSTLRLDFAGDRVTVRTDTGAPLTTPLNGSTIRWTREDGEEFRVTTGWQGSSLRQTFAAPDGQRTNLYTPGAGGTLSLRVTVTSPRLPRALDYVQRYRRQ